MPDGTYTSDVIQGHLFIVPRFIYDIKHVVVQGRSQELEMGGAKLGEGSGGPKGAHMHLWHPLWLRPCYLVIYINDVDNFYITVHYAETPFTCTSPLISSVFVRGLLHST